MAEPGGSLTAALARAGLNKKKTITAKKFNFQILFELLSHVQGCKDDDLTRPGPRPGELLII